MSLYKKIKSLGVGDDAKVTFTWEEGCDVLHYTEEHVETAIGQTGVANILAAAITAGVLYKKGNDVLEEMRDNGLLDDYKRGEESFADYVADVISENHWDYDWFENSTEKYDHKRGFTTLSMEFRVPVGDLKDEFYPLSGWEAAVQTNAGYLTLVR